MRAIITWLGIFLWCHAYSFADDKPQIVWTDILFYQNAKDVKVMTKNIKDFVAVHHPGNNQEKAHFFFEGTRQIARTEAGFGYSSMMIEGPDFVAVVGRLGHGVVFIDGRMYATKFPPFNDASLPELREYKEFKTVKIQASYGDLKATARKELVEWTPSKDLPSEWDFMIPRKPSLSTPSGNIGWCKAKRELIADSAS